MCAGTPVYYEQTENRLSPSRGWVALVSKRVGGVNLCYVGSIACECLGLEPCFANPCTGTIAMYVF